MWRSLAALINCAVILTRSPERSTEPSTTASTPNWRPISGSGVRVPLYCMIDVLETTFSSRTCARSVINSSVIPSTKYSWLGSFERFCIGRTATERIGPLSAWPNSLCLQPAHCSKATTVTTASPPTRPRIQPRHAAEFGAWASKPFAPVLTARWESTSNSEPSAAAAGTATKLSPLLEDQGPARQLKP